MSVLMTFSDLKDGTFQHIFSCHVGWGPVLLNFWGPSKYTNTIWPGATKVSTVTHWCISKAGKRVEPNGSQFFVGPPTYTNAIWPGMTKFSMDPHEGMARFYGIMSRQGRSNFTSTSEARTQHSQLFWRTFYLCTCAKTDLEWPNSAE